MFGTANGDWARVGGELHPDLVAIVLLVHALDIGDGHGPHRAACRLEREDTLVEGEGAVV